MPTAWSLPPDAAGRVRIDDDAVSHLVDVADGDARAALSALEVAASAAGVNRPGPDGPQATITAADVAQAMRRYRYDKTSDGHYDQVSAFIKSMRGSDPDAAVYWLLRMLESGEDPRFLASRMRRKRRKRAEAGGERSELTERSRGSTRHLDRRSSRSPACWRCYP